MRTSRDCSRNEGFLSIFTTADAVTKSDASPTQRDAPLFFELRILVVATFAALILLGNF